MSFKNSQCPDDASALFETVTIEMPTAMHDQFTTRARRFGMSLPERILFALDHVDGELFGGPDRMIIIRDNEKGTTIEISPQDPVHYA